MTDCSNGEMRDLLPRLLNDTVEVLERASVEGHLAACAECRAELALLGALRESLRPVTGVDVSAIIGALPDLRTSRRERWRGWRAAAAIAAITLGATSVVVATRNDRAERSAEMAIAPQRDTLDVQRTLATERGSRVAAGRAGVETRRAATAAPRELALEHGFGDLTDGELSALLNEIESLDALPVVDVEGTVMEPRSALPSAGDTSR